MDERGLDKKLGGIKDTIEDLNFRIRKLEMENERLKKEMKLFRKDINNNSRRGR